MDNRAVVSQTLTISEAFELYRADYVVFSNQSIKTEQHLMQSLGLLLLYIPDIPIVELTFPMVRDWKLELEKTKSVNTVRGYVIKLRLVLRYCKNLGLNVLDAESIPIPKRTHTKPEYLEPHEVGALLDAIDSCPDYTRENRIRAKLIISLLYASGIRVSELVSIDKDHLHDGKFTVIGKGNKPRLCFYDERTANLIEEYLAIRKDKHAALFYSDQAHGRVSVGTVQTVVKCAGDKIGKRVHPHTLRHSFATNKLENNLNMRYLQVMLGHESLDTTAMYSHVVDKSLEREYQSTHSI